MLGNGASMRHLDLELFSGVTTIGLDAGSQRWEELDWYPTHYCCFDDRLIEARHAAIRSLISDGRIQTAFLSSRILDFCPELAKERRCFFMDTFSAEWHERQGRKRGLPFWPHPAFRTPAGAPITWTAYTVRYGIFLGYAKLYLVGIDCGYGYGRQNEDGRAATKKEAQEDRQLTSLEAVRDDVITQSLPVAIWNCSTESRLSSSGVFPSEDLDRALGRPGLGAVAVRVNSHSEDSALGSLRRWDQPAAVPKYPHVAGAPVPLVFLAEGPASETFESRVKAEFENARHLRAAFSSVIVHGCSQARNREGDREQSGAVPQAVGAIKLLRMYGRYVFIVGADCVPLRPNWLAELQRIVDAAAPFWAMTDLNAFWRGARDGDFAALIESPGVFATGDAGFQAWLQDFRLPASERAAQDTGGQNELPYGCRRFHHTEFIQRDPRCAEPADSGTSSLDGIRARFPCTYILYDCRPAGRSAGAAAPAEAAGERSVPETREPGRAAPKMSDPEDRHPAGQQGNAVPSSDVASLASSPTTAGADDPLIRHPTKADSLALLRRMGVPIETILDVGVQTCTAELLRGFSDKHHVLMEPIAEFKTAIEKNYGRAGVSHELVEVAVCDREGPVTLKTSTVVPGRPVSHARIVSENGEGSQYRQVRGQTLDGLVEERDLKKPYLLKIDVDGAELAVLAGAPAVLRDCSVVVIETGVGNLIERCNALDRAGFQPFDIVDLCYYSGRFVQADLVFLNSKTVREYGLELYRDGFDVSQWRNYPDAPASR